MSFDDRIRDSLARAGDGIVPSPAGTEELIVRAGRRRRRQRALMGGTGATVIALVIGVAVMQGGNTPTAQVRTAAEPGDTQTIESIQSAIGIGTIPSDATTSPPTKAPASVGSAPPASIARPPQTTTVVPTTTAPPPADDTVVVTQADAGKTITLRVGQRLDVRLDGGSGSIYSQPETDNTSVLRNLGGKADSETGHAAGLFEGASPGRAHVSASKDARCRQSQPPCMVPTELWQVTVNVN